MCGILHIYYLVYFETHAILKISILIGIITSLLNHSLTYTLLKFVDRLCMISGVIINYLLINLHINMRQKQFLCNVLLSLSITTFLINKKINYFSVFHIFAHIILTFLHIIMITSIL
jgi:hypothetical protein